MVILYCSDGNKIHGGEALSPAWAKLYDDMILFIVKLTAGAQMEGGQLATSKSYQLSKPQPKHY